MKKLLYLLIIPAIFISCEEEKDKILREKRIIELREDNKSLYTESKNLEDLYRISEVNLNSHQYYLLEIGTKGFRNYSFTIEHNPSCSCGWIK